MHNITPLYELTRRLAAVAAGREPAELVIRNARIINVFTAEILDGLDIAVAGGRIAYIGNADHCVGANTRVYDANGRYVAPGFMDGHIHVESSMLLARQYARAVLPHGTTAIFCDPHEIANVLGTRGVQLMMDDSQGAPLRLYVTMPSCVPAVSAFEDAGAQILPKDVEEFMTNEQVIGLGEVMNFPGVLSGDDKMHDEIIATLKAGKTVTGHYSMPETDRGLCGYIASGVRCCHESTRAEDALAKIRLGMYVQVREGSAWHDLKEVIRAATETRVDTRLVTLVSDDTHPDTLLKQGHLDHVVRRAIEEGVNPVTAIQMVTLNVAQLYSVDKDMGSIAPGKLADMVVLSDLSRVTVDSVFVGGELISDAGRLSAEIGRSACPDWALNSVKLPRAQTSEDFAVEAPKGAGAAALTRVMEIIEAKVGTVAREFELPVKDGRVCADPAKDIMKLAVIERYSGKGGRSFGFVKGFSIKSGAVASTVAHDAHNLCVMGTNDEDMALCANKLHESGGGMVAVQDGKVLAHVELPVAGLMSLDSAEEVAARVEALDAAWKELGCALVSPYMTMALLPLAVLPELRLTNRGLVDTVEYRFTDLFV